MGQPVVHFEVVGKDGAKLRDYYSKLFDWNFHAPPPEIPADYQTVDREENRAADGENGISGGVGSAHGDYAYVTFYVASEDVEADLARAEELGGTRVMGPEDIGANIVLGQFTDPEGLLVGLVNAPRPARNGN